MNRSFLFVSVMLLAFETTGARAQCVEAASRAGGDECRVAVENGAIVYVAGDPTGRCTVYSEEPLLSFTGESTDTPARNACDQHEGTLDLDSRAAVRLAQSELCVATARAATDACRVVFDEGRVVAVFAPAEARGGACVVFGEPPSEALAASAQAATRDPDTGCSMRTTALSEEGRSRLNALAPTLGTAGLPTVGTSTAGAEGALAETLQLLGQIVVDRASQAAFNRIRDQLKDWLQCDAAASARAVALPATCAVLETLRLQDISTLPTSLSSALAADALGAVLAELDASTASAVFEVVLVPLVRELILPLASGRTRTLGPEHLQSAIMQMQLALEHRSLPSEAWSQQTDLQKFISLLGTGLSAALRCAQIQNAGGSLGSACDLLAEIRARLPNGASEREERAAARIGELLRRTLQQDVPDGVTDVDRAHNVVDALFEATCLALGTPACELEPVDEEEQQGADPADVENENSRRRTIELVRAAHGLASAVVDRDGHRVVVGFRTIIEHALDGAPASDEHREIFRALRIAAAILTYVETFSAEGEANTPEARRAVLESMVDEFTDRTGRFDDLVFSFGGSLGGQVGLRVGEGHLGFWGPAHLRLGLAMTYLPPEDCVAGFHMSLSFFDLAGYLAFEDGLVVRTPSPYDALAPTFSFGLSFGRELPVVITADIGWQPSYRFIGTDDPEQGDIPPVVLPAVDTERRSNQQWFSVGLSVGIHVPLLDFN